METKITHTPGPWNVRNHGDTNLYTVEQTDGQLRSIIAEIREAWLCPEHVGDGNQAPRIARLIAAAPEMLEALKQANEQLGNDPRWKVSTLRLDVIRAAIAKATGQD